MDFSAALAATFNDNDRITRTSWNNRSAFIEVVDGRLCIRGGVDLASGNARTDGMPYPFTVSESDYFGDDWEVVADA